MTMPNIRSSELAVRREPFVEARYVLDGQMWSNCVVYERHATRLPLPEALPAQNVTGLCFWYVCLLPSRRAKAWVGQVPRAPDKYGVQAGTHGRKLVGQRSDAIPQSGKDGNRAGTRNESREVGPWRGGGKSREPTSAGYLLVPWAQRRRRRRSFSAETYPLPLWHGRESLRFARAQQVYRQPKMLGDLWLNANDADSRSCGNRGSGVAGKPSILMARSISTPASKHPGIAA